MVSTVWSKIVGFQRLFGSIYKNWHFKHASLPSQRSNMGNASDVSIQLSQMKGRNVSTQAVPTDL